MQPHSFSKTACRVFAEEMKCSGQGQPGLTHALSSQVLGVDDAGPGADRCCRLGVPASCAVTHALVCVMLCPQGASLQSMRPM